MASKPGPLSQVPWEQMGNYKYALLLPFVGAIAAGADDADSWYSHMMGIAACRWALGQVFITASRTNAISGNHRIQKRAINFEQVDREENWDDFILLQVYVMTLVHWVLPGFSGFPAFNAQGLAVCLALHAGPTELVYYWVHRALHHHSLFAQYHSHHHKSFVTEPVSGTCHPFAENCVYTAIFAIPMLGTWLLGGASLSMLYAYTCVFDVMNMVGHCNWEFVPCGLYRAVPLLKYLVYTPTYHSLHHSRVHTNFCLFMPIYDIAFGTLERDWHRAADPANAPGAPPGLKPQWTSDRIQEEARSRTYEAPECVFLAHGTDLLSALHLPMLLRSMSSHPYVPHWCLYPLYPLVCVAALLLWAFGSVFVSHVERVDRKPVQTWVVPRFGFQYFLGQTEERRINQLIEDAIVDADALGVKVFGLGALNKAEHLNAGGGVFPPRLDARLGKDGKELRTRVVHGNTLTAACLLRELPPGVGEVFITGATSKLGRACALYLCARGVTVKMLTSSESRFEHIVAEARAGVGAEKGLGGGHSAEDGAAAAARLERCTSHADGASCTSWIVAKQCGAADQACASAGTHFHQVVVPPIDRHRSADCTYGELAAMDLPPSAQDTKSCELFMPRRRVFACHAGALTHLLSGWAHHEVGAIDVGAIDSVWGAALGLGFKPATKGWPADAEASAHAEVAKAAANAEAVKARGARPSDEPVVAVARAEHVTAMEEDQGHSLELVSVGHGLRQRRTQRKSAGLAGSTVGGVGARTPSPPTSAFVAVSSLSSPSLDIRSGSTVDGGEASPVRHAAFLASTTQEGAAQGAAQGGAAMKRKSAAPAPGSPSAMRKATKLLA